MANIVRPVPGPAGTNGDPGAAGAPGSQILTAAGVPSNGLGVDGDFYINISNNDYYKKESGAWSFKGQLAGASMPTGGTTGQALVKNSNADFDSTWGTVIPTGTFLSFAGFDNAGNLHSIPGWLFNDTTKGLFFERDLVPNNLTGYQNFNDHYSAVLPAQNSPNESWNFISRFIEFDRDSSGFSIGTSGEAYTDQSTYLKHVGTGNIGGLAFTKNSFELGNGTDPITVKSLAYAFGFGQMRSGVTLDGPIQGYGFQPNMAAGSIQTSNAYLNAFYDFANIDTATGPYTSFAANPTVLSIKNNCNYTGAGLGANIATFTGNAGYTGLGIFSQLGTFGTGSPQFISINPTVTSTTNATGIYANMSNVSGVNVKAIDVVGDVAINGALTFTGALSVGQLSAFYAANPVDGGGNPTTLHGLVTSMTALDGVTTANADVLGVNTAMLITLEDNSVTTSGPLGIGMAALALPCVVQTHTGATLDFMHAAAYVLSLDPGSTGGTIDEVNLCRSLAIPNGITTINKLRGFYYSEPFGGAGTVRHGFYNEAAIDNYFAGSLLIGGTPISDDVVSNASVALEIKSVTKALLHARMTTTERDALTAVNGMQIYNLTLDKHQGYAAGAWVDLH